MGEQNPLSISGYVSTNQVLTIIPNDTLQVGNPYTGFYNGNLNFNVYGVNIPFTFMYSNQKASYSHPFNQYSIQPEYKWVRTRLGYTSMTFSPYTLNGHVFLGAGVDADPEGILKVSAMAGRLIKKNEYDSTNSLQVPAYKRMGYGIKIGFVNNGDHGDIIVFKARDVMDSLGLPNDLNITPMENSVVSMVLGKKILSNLSISGEYSASYLTRDLSSEKNQNGEKFYKPATWFMNVRQTTTVKHALNANAKLVCPGYSIGIGYERVDPDYTTLGAYYFTNNFENIALNFSTNLFNNKLSLAGNAGFQRDNIENNELNNNVRLVESINIGFKPDDSKNFSLSYSNFASYTNVKSTFDYINETSPYENWDTLQYRQVSQSFNYNGSFVLKNSESENTQSLNTFAMLQLSNNENNGVQNDQSRFYNAGISHSINLKDHEINIASSLNFNLNETGNSNSFTWGPGVNISKSFLKKTLSAHLFTSYNRSTMQGYSSSNIINLRAGAAYTLNKKHTFNINTLMQNRMNKVEESGLKDSNRVYSLTFNYMYNFNLLDLSKKKTTDPE
jgi:hypothetical protein